jgi:hypothetical protein
VCVCVCVCTAGHSEKSTAKLFSFWNVVTVLLIYLERNSRPVLPKYIAVYFTTSTTMACEKNKMPMPQNAMFICVPHGLT